MIVQIEQKILDGKGLEAALQLARSKGQKIVFTNGCFDILHRGHVDYLSKARSLGDLLIVGLNSDKSVQRIKGESRPIQDENSRAEILASLLFVDYVVLFDQDTPLELIEKVKPDFLVKGADYKPENIVGHEIVEEKGGKVVTIEFLQGYSTSKIVEKIRTT